MTIGNAKQWLVTLGALLSAPLLTGANGVDGMYEIRILAAHNKERATADLAPLRWDPALAESAKAWANHLAATDAFEHAPESRKPQGENLWAGTRGYYGLERQIDAWVREKKYFRSGIFPNNSTTGRVGDVGHYTQLMWRETQAVGCATVTGRTDDYLVCRYSNAGNYRGQIPF
ncbi:CAP domain-containing protein [Sphingomonas sp. RS2018]